MSPGQLRPSVGGHDHVRGADDAPVTLVEYGDFECPHCARAHPIVESVLARLGGRVRFVWRNFPLTEIHPHAAHAAEAAESAGAQGHFWEMHDLLFEHQRALDDASLARLARQAGADAAVVARELDDERWLERVRADFMSGVRSGVNGTPAFFINGQRFDGGWDADSLTQALESVPR